MEDVLSAKMSFAFNKTVSSHLSLLVRSSPLRLVVHTSSDKFAQASLQLTLGSPSTWTREDKSSQTLIPAVTHIFYGNTLRIGEAARR